MAARALPSRERTPKRVCDAGYLEVLWRRHGALLSELDRVAARIDSVESYLERPGANTVLGEVARNRLKSKQRDLLAAFRQVRALAPRAIQILETTATPPRAQTRCSAGV